MLMSTTCASKISWILSPDEVVHRLHVELGGEALLDAVDDRQLGRALVGLGQQPLRLVEQPRVLEGDAQARGEGRQQPHVGSLKASVGRGSAARCGRTTVSPDDQRREEHGLRRLALNGRRSIARALG